MRTMSMETERLFLSLDSGDLSRFMDSCDEERAFTTSTGQTVKLRKVHPEPMGNSLLGELAPWLAYLGLWWIILYWMSP